MRDGLMRGLDPQRDEALHVEDVLGGDGVGEGGERGFERADFGEREFDLGKVFLDGAIADGERVGTEGEEQQGEEQGCAAGDGGERGERGMGGEVCDGAFGGGDLGEGEGVQDEGRHCGGKENWAAGRYSNGG